MKNKLKFVLIICILFFSSFYFSRDFRNIILEINDVFIKTSYSVIDKTSFVIKRYFNQVQTIKDLSIENEELKKYKLLYTSVEKEYNELLLLNKIKPLKTQFTLRQILSYEKLSNFTRFWIDFDEIKDGKIYGLIYDNYAVGVMFKKNHRALGLNLYDENCIFSVRIGKDNIPAILKGGKNGPRLEYITEYEKIKIGDLVYTNGMDNIFPDGIVVGSIFNISKEPGYKTAELINIKNISPHKFIFISEFN